MAPGLERTLARLEAFGVRLGLDTTYRLLAALDEPQKRFRAVLVAGTNGKGSTAALLASIATAAGYRTGLYTSPHLETVEERIRIGGRVVESQLLADSVEAVVRVAEARLGYLPTYFEVLTAAAFCIFAQADLDLAVLEVGLGGRLDATNAADPELALITGIGLEHREYLGDSLAAIAREKAGIMRPGRPVIASVGHGMARQAIARFAAEVGADLTWAPEVVEISRFRRRAWRGQEVDLRSSQRSYRIFLPMLGEHQQRNLALAVLAAEELARRGFDRLGEEAVTRGVAATRWPGRLERVDLEACKPVLLDVAHNADGARALKRFLDREDGSYSMLFGVLTDKDVGSFLSELTDRATAVILTTPDSDRAFPPERLAAFIPDRPPFVERDLETALTSALAAQGDQLVVCGSFYLVGRVRESLRRRYGGPRAAADTIFGG